MHKIIKKADIILTICLIALGLFATFIFINDQRGATVEISVNGQLHGSYALLKNENVNIDGNIITIKNGTAYISKATCPNKDCVHQGEISRSGETIVCLPNKILVEIKGDKNEYDTIAK